MNIGKDFLCLSTITCLHDQADVVTKSLVKCICLGVHLAHPSLMAG